MEEEYKIFIGGLTIETTELQLEEHFIKFGMVYDVMIIRNKANHISKGYGFITCNNIKTYTRIINSEHLINGRIVDCHESFKKAHDPELFQENANKKIFVGGIIGEISDEDMYHYFSQFGEIRQAYVIKDPITKKCKKFGFVIMKDIEDVDKVLQVKHHFIRNIPLTTKLFVRFDLPLQKSAAKPKTCIADSKHGDKKKAKNKKKKNQAKTKKEMAREESKPRRESFTPLLDVDSAHVPGSSMILDSKLSNSFYLLCHRYGTVLKSKCNPMLASSSKLPSKHLIRSHTESNYRFNIQLF